MSGSTTSTLLAAALLVFVAVASGVLVWEGLATGLGQRAPEGAPRWRVRLRFAVGVLGFGLALWLGLGLLSHAW
ncbi:MAG TPA: hypothetical protein VLS93_09055 [Anaeromyxobacteraceae bacterium]|nr:hypothetical protein [Anaeromyxobacteraceae bacterium]